MRIVSTELVSSTGRIDRLPEASLPEVAFAGRSNVGKSSLLNALTSRRNLFKVSKTPGRTRTIVHVKAELDCSAAVYLVDLPGYGFAKVSKGAKLAWGKMIESYLECRETLHAVFVLIDIRRGAQAEEVALVDFLRAMNTPAYLVVTKMDRLPRSKQKPALSKLTRSVEADTIATSAKTGLGVDTLIATVVRACGF